MSRSYTSSPPSASVACSGAALANSYLETVQSQKVSLQTSFRTCPPAQLGARKKPPSVQTTQIINLQTLDHLTASFASIEIVNLETVDHGWSVKVSTLEVFFFSVPVCAITASGVPGGTFVSMNRFSTLCG
jgi:hypothetical protein